MQPGSDKSDTWQLHQPFGFLNPLPLNIVAYGQTGFFFEQL
nr:hypothetical protein [Paenibacillus ihuae]